MDLHMLSRHFDWLDAINRPTEKKNAQKSLPVINFKFQAVIWFALKLVKTYITIIQNVLKTSGTSVLQHCNTQSKVVVCSEMFHRSSVNCLSKSYYTVSTESL